MKYRCVSNSNGIIFCKVELGLSFTYKLLANLTFRVMVLLVARLVIRKTSRHRIL